MNAPAGADDTLYDGLDLPDEAFEDDASPGRRSPPGDGSYVERLPHVRRNNPAGADSFRESGSSSVVESSGGPWSVIRDP